MIRNEDYHQAITMMPNGQIFAGEHDSNNGYPRASLLGSYKKAAKGSLVGSTRTNGKLSGLMAKVMGKPDGDMTALMAAANVADASNLSHLQLVRLVPEAQGDPEPVFFLDAGFPTVDVPQLQLRETFYDTTATAEYLGRLEQSKATTTVYDEIAYNLPKLVDKVFTPIEDIMRTIINPQTVDIKQIAYGFKYKRNLSAAKALASIPTNSLGTMDNPTVLSSAGIHSKYKVASELNGYFNTFWKTNDVPINLTFWNPQNFTDYTETTWTGKGALDINAIRLAGGGVVPLPGITGVTAVVDLQVPANTIYCVNKQNALRLGEGAKIMRRFYDEERDAEAIKYLDFNQYLSVDAQITKLVRKFSGQVTISTGS